MSPLQMLLKRFFPKAFVNFLLIFFLHIRNLHQKLHKPTKFRKKPDVSIKNYGLSSGEP